MCKPEKVNNLPERQASPSKIVQKKPHLGAYSQTILNGLFYVSIWETVCNKTMRHFRAQAWY